MANGMVQRVVHFRQRGEDGNGIQSITRTYAISTQSATASDTTAPAISGSWSASSPAVTEAYPYLWAREVVTYTNGTSTTKYYCIGARGQNGVDAQDIEWVYIRTKTDVPPVIYSDSSYTDSNSKTYTADDHLPRVNGSGRTDIEINGGSSSYPQCADDPKGVTSEWQYEWEIKREKGTANANGHRSWTAYSGTMTLHNNYAASLLEIDIDNDNDQFGTDSDGKVIDAQSRTTNVTMFYGAERQAFTATPTISLKYEDGTSVPDDVAAATIAVVSGTSNKQYRVTVSVKATGTGSTVFGTSGHSGLYVDISGTCTYGTKSIRFTLEKLMSGAQGVSPTIYQLDLSQKVLTYSRDASNNLVAQSNSVTVGVKRTVGNTTDHLTLAASGLTCTWGYDGTYTTNALSTSNPTITVAAGSVGSHTKVSIQLSTGDKENVTIVKDGTNGANGDTPISCYRWYKEGLTPTKPTGKTDDEPDAVDYLNVPSQAQPTTSWSKTAQNRPADGWHLYMCQSVRHTSASGVITRDAWSDPVRISGATGTPGEDAEEREWIYRKNNNAGYSSTTGTANGTAISGTATVDGSTVYKCYITGDFVPTNWTDNPVGVSADNDIEYASWRDYDKTTKRWGAFHTPIIWSHYGRNGMDGDGVEYVFVRTDKNTPPTWTAEYDSTNNKDSYGVHALSDEHLPQVTVASGTAIMGNTHAYTSGRSGQKAECTDDPQGVSSTWPYEWVLMRTKDSAMADGRRVWDEYGGTMSLWAKYGEDGTSPWVADLDNEMDSISCDDTGYPVTQQTVSTVLSLFYGNTQQTIGNPTVKRNGTAMTLSTASNGVTASWNSSTRTLSVTYATTARITGKDIFTIDVQDSNSTVTRTLTFTVNGVIGDVYNLKPSVSQVNVASGTAKATLSCGYTKNVNGTLTEYDNGAVQIDSKYYIFFRRRLRDTGAWEVSASTGIGVFRRYAVDSNRRLLVETSGYSSSGLDVSTYDAVEFVLGTAVAGDAVTAISAVIDRETVPVVRDGSNGSGADVAVKCVPGSLSVPCTTAGTAIAATSVTPTFTMTIDGSSATITAISAIQRPTGISVSGSGNTRTITVAQGTPASYINQGITFDVTGKVGDDGMSFTRSIAFPMVASQKGDETPVYTIVTDPAAINFRSNAVGNYSPSTVDINVLVKKVTQSGSTDLTPSNNVIDGKYYLYYLDQEAQVWYRATNGNTYHIHEVDAGDALDGLIKSVPYVLSTSSTAHNTDDGITASNTIVRFDVPVICDGRRGSTGATGKMFFPMGEWNSTITYTRTGDLVPLVFFNDGEWNDALECYGNYYYLTADSSRNNTPNDTNSQYWHKADDFGVVITQGLFTEFAKLGKGIFSGDYLFSMNGRIGSVEYNSGTLYGDTPAYIRFLSETKKAERTQSGDFSVNNYYKSTSSVCTLNMSKGETAEVTIKAKASTGTAYVAIFLSTVSNYTTSTTSAQNFYLNGGSSAVKTVDFPTTEKTVIIKFTAPSAGTYQFRARNASSGTLAYEVNPYDAFEPNWWVDLLTGKMSAARGNFVVNVNGDVIVRGAMLSHKTYTWRLPSYSGSTATVLTWDETNNPYSPGVTPTMLADTFILIGDKSNGQFTVMLPQPQDCPGMHLRFVRGWNQSQSNIIIQVIGDLMSVDDYTVGGYGLVENVNGIMDPRGTDGGSLDQQYPYDGGTLELTSGQGRVVGSTDEYWQWIVTYNSEW